MPNNGQNKWVVQCKEGALKRFVATDPFHSIVNSMDFFGKSFSNVNLNMYNNILASYQKELFHSQTFHR